MFQLKKLNRNIIYGDIPTILDVKNINDRQDFFSLELISVQKIKHFFDVHHEYSKINIEYSLNFKKTLIKERRFQLSS